MSTIWQQPVAKLPICLKETVKYALQCYVVVWPFCPGMPSETATAVMSLMMGGILERFPRLKVCFAHGGGSFPFTIGRMQHGYLVRPDLCAQVEVASGRESFNLLLF